MAKRRCSKCGRAGHYRVTCKKRSGKKSKAKKSKAKAKAKKSKAKKSKAKKSGSWVSAGPTRSDKWTNFYHGGRTGETKHDKVWSYKIERSGKKARLVVRWGRRVGPYMTKAHPWTSEIGAVGKASALIASKLAKGYMLVF